MLLRKILMRSPTSLSARIAARLQLLDRLLRYFFTGCLIFFWIHRFTQPFDRFRKKDCQSEIPCLEIPIIYEVSLDRQADGSPNFEFPPRPPLVKECSMNGMMSWVCSGCGLAALLLHRPWGGVQLWEAHPWILHSTQGLPYPCLFGVTSLTLTVTIIRVFNL